MRERRGRTRNLLHYHLFSQLCCQRNAHSYVYNVVENYIVNHMQPSIRYELKTSDQQVSNNETSSSSAQSTSHNRNLSIIYSSDIDKIDGRFLLCGNQLGIITIHDLENTRAFGKMRLIKPLRTIPADRKSILSSVQWFPNDTGLFLAATYQGSLTLYDTNRSLPILDFPFSVETNERRTLNWCQFNPHPNYVTTALVAMENGTVRVCDISSGDSVHTFRCHHQATTMLDWNPTKEYEFVTSSKDGTVKTWDLRRMGSQPVLSLDWSKDHSYCLSHRLASRLPSYQGLSMKSTSSHDIQSKKQELLTNVQLAKAHESEVMSVRYSPCGHFLLSSGNDCKLRLWSASSGGLLSKDYSVGKRSSLPYRLEFLSFPYRDLSRPSSSFSSSSSLSSDYSLRDHLFLFPHRQQIALLPLLSGGGSVLSELSGHFDQVLTAIYRPLKQQVISSGKDGLLLLWDHSQYQQQREEDSFAVPREKMAVPLRLRFSPSSSVVSGAREEEVLESSARYYSDRLSTTTSSKNRAAQSSFLLPIIRQYLLEADLPTSSSSLAMRTSHSSDRGEERSWQLEQSQSLLRPRVSKAEIDWNEVDRLLQDDDDSSADDNNNTNSNSNNNGITSSSLDQTIITTSRDSSTSRPKKAANPRQSIEKALKKSRSQK